MEPNFRDQNGEWTKNSLRVWLKSLATRETTPNEQAAVGRALVFMYGRQTQDEQTSKATYNRNGMGFSGSDAEFLSSVAEKFIAYNRLTPRQCQCVAKSLARYSGQLMEFLDGAKKPVQSAKCDCRNGEFCPYCDPDRFGNDPDRTC